MTIEIENFIKFTGSVSLKMYDETLAEFNLILNNLYNAKKHSFLNAASDDKSQCREAMNGQYKYFEIGYGASHMWIHQKIDDISLPHRLLIVKFNDHNN